VVITDRLGNWEKIKVINESKKRRNRVIVSGRHMGFQCKKDVWVKNHTWQKKTTRTRATNKKSKKIGFRRKKIARISFIRSQKRKQA